jgi:hypothetical protein
MDFEEDRSEKPVGKPGEPETEPETTSSDSTARWQQSFIEHAEGAGSSRGLVIWLVVGLVLVIVLTFILAA